MSSGQYKRSDKFNSVIIRDGLVVRLNKNGTIRTVLGKYGNKMRPIKTLTIHTLTNTKEHNMSKKVMLSLLAQGNTGTEILSILDALATDNVSGFDYIESPMIESVLGIPTLEEVAF